MGVVPQGTAVIGMVMLLKLVPLSAAKVKDTVVVAADWFVAIVTLDISALVTFPLIASSIVAPLLVVAFTYFASGFTVGDGVDDAVEVIVGAGVGVGVFVGVGVSVGVVFCVGIGVGVGVGVAVGKGVGEGVGLGVGVGANANVAEITVTPWMFWIV